MRVCAGVYFSCIIKGQYVVEDEQAVARLKKEGDWGQEYLPGLSVDSRWPRVVQGGFSFTFVYRSVLRNGRRRFCCCSKQDALIMHSCSLPALIDHEQMCYVSKRWVGAAATLGQFSQQRLPLVVVVVLRWTGSECRISSSSELTLRPSWPSLL